MPILLYKAQAHRRVAPLPFALIIARPGFAKSASGVGGRVVLGINSEHHEGTHYDDTDDHNDN
eukprot:1303849-Pyramimonas_sp.AAC.1